MPQDLIGCWNHRKLKALIPRVAVAPKIFASDPPSAERIILPSFFIELRFCGSKVCLNMCHGNLKNADGFPYYLKTNLLNLRNYCECIAESNTVPFDLLTNERKSKYCLR